MKTISAAVVSALVFSNAYAAGLGKLTVLSPLGQPLRAEIELTSVSRDEAGALVARLASPEAFRQANIEYTPALSSLQFSVEQRGERQFVRVTSSQPVNEPFVDLLLEVSGPHGRLVREYTFLLDPADLRGSQSAQVAPAGRNGQGMRTPAAPAARPEAPARAERAAPASAAANAPADQYQVRSGDTLAKIAGQVKPGGVSLDQMLVALYRNNPDAFAGQNMNRLRAGQILSVPDADTARGVPAAEARRVVVAQSADFNSYRNKLAGQVAESTAQQSEGRQGAGGRISATVEERQTPASEARDKLKLSNVAPAAGGGASAEDVIAKEKALAEANARVKELERNVSELQKLLEIKNKSLAEQQKQADAAKVAVPATETKPEAVVAQAPAAATQPAPAAEPQPGAPEAKPAAAETAKAEPVKPAAKPRPAPEPVPEPSFTDSLLENPLVLPGFGALLVALGGLGIYRARRQKQGKQFEDSLISDSSLKSNSLFGSTGGQSVDTNNIVFNSSFSPSVSQLDTNEVDPVAEADVYIAYGRDAQAEEILKEALRNQPERHAVRVKLLEIYSNRKDLRAFEVLATELYGMTKGEGDEWAQAAAMGASIDPENPLYAGGKNTVAGRESATVLGVPTQPLDEQGLATLLADTQSGADADHGVVDAGGMLDTNHAFFNSTEVDANRPVEARNEDYASLEPQAQPAAPSSNEIDFDLGDLNIAGAGPAETATPEPLASRAAPLDPAAELASIDFNFLDEPSPATPADEAEPGLPADTGGALGDLPRFDSTLHPDPLQLDPAPAPEVPDLAFTTDNELPSLEPTAELGALNLDDHPAEPAPLEVDIPDLDTPVPAETRLGSSASDPLDFDLSGISLELSPTESDASMNDFGLGDIGADESSSAVAEMATKLDLAIAYQEIGDKEGARELLDEVLKGGTPEQSERAKSLLLELA